MKYLIFALLLLTTASAIGATISETPTAPQPLQGTDKVPMGRQGTSTAYTATMGQISDYVKAQPGTTANVVDTASKRFTSDSEKAAWNAKQAPLSNAVTLGKIGESNGAPTWNGVAWPGGGGGEGGTAYFNGRPSPIFPQAGDYTAAQVGADPVGTAAANMSAHTSSYDHTNIPNAGQKAALAGSSGTPGIGNKFVTDTDARLTNSRAPNAHAASHGAGASDPVTISTSQVTGLDAALTGKQATLGNAATLGKISEGGNLPLWNGGTWPGGAGSGDMYKATYDPQGKQSDAFDRANHTGTQAAGTITGLAPSATTNTTTTANITDSTDKRFVTDAQRTVLGNTSGTNSGNVTLGTTNGLSLSGQQLSLQAATNAQPGALTAADHTTYSNAASLAATALQPAGNGSALTNMTKTQVGLPNVDNTSDANKPISTATQNALDLKAPKDNPTFTTGITSPAYNTNGPDGSHALNVRNSVSRTYTPQEGDMDTDAAGRIWIYVSGQWVEKGATYTLPTASADTKGGAKVGPHLTIDGNGVLDVMLSSLGSSGLVTAGLSGDATIRKGFAYVAASSGKWTFANYSSGTTTLFSNYTGTVCAATSGGLNIVNPTTFTNRTSSCAKVYAGTYATIQSKGDGKYWVTTNRNLTKQTGAASGTGGGGGGGGTRTTKPSYGTQLDTNNALYASLVNAWAFNEGGGTTIHDSVTGTATTISGGVLDANGFTTDATGTGAALPTPAALRGSAVTLVWGGRILSNGVLTGNPVFVGTSYNAANDSPWIGLSIGRVNGAPATLRTAFNIAGTYNDNNVTSTFTTGNDYSLATTYGAGTLTTYVGGTSVSTQSVASISYGTGSNLQIQGHWASSAYNIGARGSYCLTFNRVLTPTELASIASNPWQFWSP